MLLILPLWKVDINLYQRHPVGMRSVICDLKLQRLVALGLKSKRQKQGKVQKNDKQQFGKQNLFQWEVLSPLHWTQNWCYLLLWSLWGSTRHEAATFLWCRGHLAFIHYASRLWPTQMVNSTSHNRAGHHFSIFPMLHNTLLQFTCMACKPHVTRVYIGMKFISYRLPHDLPYCLRIPPLLLTVIHCKQDFKFWSLL